MENQPLRGFQIIDGVICDFGIPRISEPEQKKLLLEAAATANFSNDVHESAHAEYEKDEHSQIPSGIKSELIKKFKKTRPFGYCKSIECKKSESNLGLIWAAPFGTEVGYNCVDCLSKFICRSRNELEGTAIPIIFFPNTDGSTEFTELHDTINTRFTIEFVQNGLIIGNSSVVEYEFKKINGQLMCQIQKIPKPVPFTIIPGTAYILTIKGRHVCENIILGKQCLSMNPDYVPSTFLAKSVPCGVPGWAEDNERRTAKERGKINVYKFCPACAIKHIKDKSSWSKPKALPSPLKKEINKDYWKQKYTELQMENAELRIQVAELQAQVMEFKTFSRVN